MTLLPLAVVESWQAAINGTRAGFSAEVLRWFCGAHGAVVVEQLERWQLPDALGTSEKIVASAFRVQGGRVVRYQRFDELRDALMASHLGDEHEVINRS